MYPGSLLITFLSLVAAVAAAPTTTACSKDNCLRAVIASAFPTRLGAADCSSYFLKTVTPATYTSTYTVTFTPTATIGATITNLATVTGTLTVSSIVSLTTTTITTTTTTSTATATTTTDSIDLDKRDLPEYMRGGVVKVAARQATRTPSSIPSYASACSGSVRYSSACSCIGVTASTTTTTVTTTVTATSSQTTSTATTTLTTATVDVTSTMLISTIASTETSTSTSSTVDTTTTPIVDGSTAYCSYNYITPNDDEFSTVCGENIDSTPFAIAYQDSFSSCIDLCSTTPGCLSTTFLYGQGSGFDCYLYDSHAPKGEFSSAVSADLISSPPQDS